MTRTIFKVVSLCSVLALTSSCISFVTDCCKSHYINRSSYDVTISTYESNGESETFTLAPGKKKMVSFNGTLRDDYLMPSTVRVEEHEEAWFDSYFKIPRTDHYANFHDR